MYKIPELTMLLIDKHIVEEAREVVRLPFVSHVLAFCNVRSSSSWKEIWDSRLDPRQESPRALFLCLEPCNIAFQ